MIAVARTLDLVALIALWIFASLFVQSAWFAQAPAIVGPALVFDLTVTAALVHWLVGLRWGRLPKWTLAPVLIIGAALGAHLLPDQRGMVVLVYALAELTAVGIVVLRARKFRGAWRGVRSAGMPRGDALQAGLVAALESERLASAVRLEMEMFALAFAGIWFRPNVVEGSVPFGHHRESGWTALAAVLVVLSLVEGAALHVVLAIHGHETTAVVVSLLYAYGVIWIIGDAQGLRLRPTLVDRAGVTLRLGLRWRARIHQLQIASVEEMNDEPRDGELKLVTIGEPNVRLVLRRPVVVTGLFGIERRADRLLLLLDEPARFVSALPRDGEGRAP